MSLLETQVGEPCRSCGEYVCQGDVLICVPTDDCDPGRVRTLVPDIELPNVGCVLGPVDVNGDGIHDLAVENGVYFGPISSETILLRSQDVMFFQEDSDFTSTETLGFEDLNGDGFVDAMVHFFHRRAVYDYSRLMVVWGPLDGEYCMDACPIDPGIANSPVCPINRDTNCDCNISRTGSYGPVPCAYNREVVDFEFSQFKALAYPGPRSPCQLPDGVLTGDVNGDGYTDIINVVNCDTGDRNCEFARVRIDLGPNSPDSDSCFLNPAVSVCEVEFDVPAITAPRFQFCGVNDFSGDFINDIYLPLELHNGDYGELYSFYDIRDLLDGGAPSRGVVAGQWRTATSSPVAIGDVDGNGYNDFAGGFYGNELHPVGRFMLADSPESWLYGVLEVYDVLGCVGQVLAFNDYNEDMIMDIFMTCWTEERAWAAIFYGPISSGVWDYRLADWYLEFPDHVSPRGGGSVLGDVSGDGRTDWAYAIGNGVVWIEFGPQLGGR